MAAKILDGSVEKASEFVEETTFNTFPTGPTMLGFGGFHNPVKIKKTTIVDSFPYLKGAGGANALQSTKSQKVSEAFEASIELRPTAWTMLPYVMCAANATTYAIGDNVFDVAMGIKINDQFETVTGGCFNKFDCTIEEDKAAVANLSGLFAAVSGFGATYIGAGAHAADPSGTALSMAGVTGMLYDASALSAVEAHVDKIKFGIEYDAIPIKDLASSATSKIAGWGFGQRKTSLELGMTIDDMTLAAEMLAGTANTFAFTALGKTLTFSAVIWEGDWEQELNREDVLGMTLKASNATLVIT